MPSQKINCDKVSVGEKNLQHLQTQLNIEYIRYKIAVSKFDYHSTIALMRRGLEWEFEAEMS